VRKNISKKHITISTILLMTLAFTIFALPIVKAHDPPWTIPTYSYINVSPSPIGVGQNVYVLIWVHPNPPTASGIGGDRWRDMTILVTKPDGTTQTLGPYYSDPTGSHYVSYTPEQLGTYKFEFDFPGQVMSWIGPTGLPPADIDYLERRGLDVFENDTFLGSTATAYLTVQQEPIEKIPDTPLPNEYWTRPIEGQNTAWAKLASHWLGGAHTGGYRNRWQKMGIAPNSPHIMWTKPIEFGGIVGGITGIPEVGFYSGGSYEGRFYPALIMAGRLYFELPLGHSGQGGGYVCLDLRTGEELWYREDVGGISKGQLYEYESINQHGVVGGVLWRTSGSTWIGYDAWTGMAAYNLTNVPSGFEVYTDYGEMERYVLNYNDRRLLLWSTAATNSSNLVRSPGISSNAYQFRPNGKSIDMSTNYLWNVSLPDLPGDGNPTIVSVIPGDLIFGTSSTWPNFRQTGTPDPYTLWAISIKPESRGQLLWIKNYAAPPNYVTRRIGVSHMSYEVVDPVNRVFVMPEDESMQYLGYSIDTGELLWGPTTDEKRPFTYYGSGAGKGPVGWFADGVLYQQGYGGEIFAYDTSNGNLLWKYDDTNSGLETVWGNYPIFVGAIQDGKVFAFNNEHSPNLPLYKGEKIRAVDADTGEEIWSLLGWGGQRGGGGTNTMVVAEGFVVYYNYYDNQIYAIGKGPSATTVQAPLTTITQGETLMLAGTVTDQSSGAVGTPAMSDESMSGWMEYLYMQKPMPADAKGVEVVLETLDPNGNYYEIGRATTDNDGNYALKWKPEVPGEYKIVASFLGSESYWGSHDTAYVGVDEAPQPTPPPDATPAPMTDTYLAGSTIAILAGIAIAVFLLLRKK
jgi:outer membrane protein assembly factor BamB